VKPATSVAEINSWASTATKGLITQVIPPGTPFDMVLTNAVYFKGSWVHPFKKDQTTSKPFTTDKGAKVNVPTMQKRFKSSDPGPRPVKYAETASFKVSFDIFL
jgi:serpin B